MRRLVTHHCAERQSCRKALPVSNAAGRNERNLELRARVSRMPLGRLCCGAHLLVRPSHKHEAANVVLTGV